MTQTGEVGIQERVEGLVRDILKGNRQPSAAELIDEVVNVTQETGARWVIKPVIEVLSEDHSLTFSCREYLSSLLSDDSLENALKGEPSRRREIESSIDTLLRQSSAYKSSTGFREMLQFMARFRDYAPYNNMLVRLQNPSCSFFATEKDWRERFERSLKEDARPMLILAPMHPVMLVFDLDQTTGRALPSEIENFAKFEGETDEEQGFWWTSEILERTCRNAWIHDRIRVDFKELSMTNAGFATVVHGDEKSKMRIAIRQTLDQRSAYGVLCHELAHIYLGHLGTDADHWWPSRSQLEHHTEEIEAEAVAYLVTDRARLAGASARYIAGHLQGETLPQTVSLDLVAKVSNRIEEMGKRNLPERPERRSKTKKGNRQ